MLLHKNILPMTATVLSAAAALFTSAEPRTIWFLAAELRTYTTATSHTHTHREPARPVGKSSGSHLCKLGSNQSRWDLDGCLLDVFLWFHSLMRTLWHCESVHSDINLQLPFKVIMRPWCSVIDDVWSRACALARQIFSGRSTCVHVDSPHVQGFRAHMQTVINDWSAEFGWAVSLVI